MHYLSAANDRQFTLNMKECPELLNAEEYDQICREMLAFQEANNRLTYSDEETGETNLVTVEDKSFSLSEEPQEPQEPQESRAPETTGESEASVSEVAAASVQEYTPAPAQPADVPMPPPQAKPSLLQSVKGFFRS
jgi:hypothetical protein